MSAARRWYVCDMDDGVLRIEPTRGAAVTWWKHHSDAFRVVGRHSYCAGYYSYTVGDIAGGRAEIAIVREDMLPRYGIDTAPAQIRPRYPHKDRPHELAEDEEENS